MKGLGFGDWTYDRDYDGEGFIVPVGCFVENSYFKNSGYLYLTHCYRNEKRVRIQHPDGHELLFSAKGNFPSSRVKFYLDEEGFIDSYEITDEE